MTTVKKGIAGQLHLNTKPTKPEVKTQAARYISPMENYIGYHNKAYASEFENPKPMTPAEKRMGKVIDEYGNEETATTRIQNRAKKLSDTRTANASAFYPSSKRMSATRSWQIIKDSMSKDELEEHYKQNPKDRPVKLTPVKLDPGLTQMLGAHFFTDDEDWMI